MKRERTKLLLSLLLLLAITVSDININLMLPLNNMEVVAEKKNVYSYYSENPYTMYLDDDANAYSLDLKTGKLTQKKKLLFGTKVKVIGTATSYRHGTDYDYAYYYNKIITPDGKKYFIDSVDLTDEKPDMSPRYIYKKQEPQTMYFYNTAYVYSINCKTGSRKVKKKIKVRTAVTVLGTVSPSEAWDGYDYYKIKNSAGNIYYVSTGVLDPNKPAPFNTDYKKTKRYKKISEKYQKKVDKIMSNYVITFDDLLYVSSLIGADTLIEWVNEGDSWEDIVSSAEWATTPHQLE